MRVLRNTSLLLALCVCAALAQAPAGSFAISGIVTNSVTGEPVKRALVQLRVPTAPLTLPTALTAFTDSGGAFLFNGLAGGLYFISARKPGFTSALGGGSGMIRLSRTTDNVAIPLLPFGTITGKVVDEDGLAVRAVDVVALTVSVVDGLRVTNQSGTAKTDDRGLYRIPNLSNGKYYVKATARSGGTSLYAGDTTPLSGLENEGFRPVYAGGGGKLESAKPVLVQPGIELRANIALRFEPAFRIRGTLANQAVRRTVSYELIEPGEFSLPVRTNLNGDTGRFEIPDVVPGSYVLRATQGDARAEVNVNVSGSDVEALVLPLAGPVDIKVRTQFANSPPEASGQSAEETYRSRGGCRVSLHRIGDPSQGGQDMARGDSNDENLISGIYPGSYSATSTCSGAYLRSLLYGNRDLLANPVLTVAPGELPPPVEITAMYGGAKLSGTLPTNASRNPQQAYVLAVPRVGGAAALNLIFAMREGDDGKETTFMFTGVAPGSYALWAFVEGADFPFREPGFLETLSGGLTVEVDEKSEKHVTLTEVIQ